MIDLNQLQRDTDTAIEQLFETTTKWDELDGRTNCIETKYITTNSGDSYYEVVIGWVDPSQYDFRMDVGTILYEMKEEYDNYDIEIVTTW
jgi:hypothetical protein